MFGFLLKILIIAAVVAGIGGYIVIKRGGSLSDIPGQLANLPAIFSTQNIPGLIASLNLRSIDTSDLGGKLSSTLDAIVTHPGRNAGPVVLGVQVTNDSISTITNVLLNLPNDQLTQIRQIMCASPSAE